jgi:serine/threonine-protein kinase PknK
VSAPRFPVGLPTRLRPVRVLGTGATSVVWQVRDTEAGVDLAVKVVSPRPGSTVDPGRRAETEARAVARLGELSGVVRLHEVGRTAAGEAWLVVDLMPGGSLAERAPLPCARVAAIGAELAATLAGAHRCGVRHGDLTPDNVLFDDADRPALADFGMAGLSHAADDPGGLTPAFAAPERLRGAAPSEAADVWSLGATLATVRDPEESSACGGALERILVSCCSEAPTERPDAAAVHDALDALVPR